MKTITSAAVLLSVWLCAFVDHSQAEPPLSVTLEYLIQHTADSGLVFVRNGSEHTSAEAAKLMRGKYDQVKAKVHTPEDFIRLAATESRLTGKPYLVKLPDGRSVPSREWLTETLRKYRTAHPD